jgi:glycosyltransferase AglD
LLHQTRDLGDPISTTVKELGSSRHKDGCDVSLVLACYNEEPVFSESMAQIFQIMDHTCWSYEVIFVDDCSIDRTRDLIEGLIAGDDRHNLSKLFHGTNSGRGRAVSDGLRIARGKVAGFIDIDLEVHARYIPTCILAIEAGHDVATAHRIYKFYWRGIIRWMLSQGYKQLQRALLGVNLKDTETGYKFFNRERILPILDQIEEGGWFWDTEVMVRSYLSGYRIAEIPCLFQRRFDKKSSVSLVGDTLQYWRNLLAFRKVVGSMRVVEPLP